MITESQCRRIIDEVVTYAKSRKVDGVEVYVAGSNVATSRFANNAMTQNQAPDSYAVSVRLLLNGRQVRMENEPGGDLKQLVENAIEAAKLVERDEGLVELYRPTAKNKVVAVDRYHKATASLSPDERAQKVRQIIGVAKEKGLVAAGVVATGTTFECIGNSRGLYEYHRQTSAECSITMCHGASTGWSKAQAPAVTQIDFQELAERAAQKADAGANPFDIDPGRYTVVMEPSAVLDILGYLWYDFAATAHQDKMTALLGKVGKMVFGENISVVDDVFHPLQSGAPFDGEGVPRKKVELVEAGVVKNLVFGRRAAFNRKAESHAAGEPTGHGLLQPSPEGEYPLNIVIAGGTTSLADMVATTDRGIYLTRVWYVRQVDPQEQIVTGMTRDGTFLIEGGRIVRPVKNLRFNVSLLQLLTNVITLGESVRTAGAEGFPAVVPAMKIKDFNFTEVTRF